MKAQSKSRINDVEDKETHVILTLSLLFGWKINEPFRLENAYNFTLYFFMTTLTKIFIIKIVIKNIHKLNFIHLKTKQLIYFSSEAKVPKMLQINQCHQNK